MKQFCYLCKNCEGRWSSDNSKCIVTGLPVNATKGRKCKNFKDDGSKLRKKF